MRYSLFLLVLFTSTCFAQDNISSRIDSVVTSQKDLSGVVLVTRNGKTIYYKAMGLREYSPAISIQKTDIFELASLSKQFTAMIIMMLKEKGRIAYDDPLEKYLDVPYKKITIRHLLTHTSGLPDYQDVMDKYWDKTKVASNKEAIEYLNRYSPPKSFEPGEKYEYSNTGYLLLASVAEKVSGRDFIQLCRDWIFKPLKMKSTDIRTLEEKAAVKNFAIGHVYVAERNRFIRADSFPSSNYTIWLGNRKGPGRISSTAEDLSRWDEALRSNKLIKASTLQEAFTPMKLNNGQYSYYGFGWEIIKDSSQGKVVMHTGDNPGYSTRIVRNLDSKLTMIFLSNNNFEYWGEVAKAISDIADSVPASK